MILDPAEPTSVTRDLWVRAGVPLRPTEADAAQLEAWALRWHGMPRDSHLVERYCAEHLPPGRILLYGAGSHTAHLVDLLRERPALQAVGILDRLASGSTTYCGLPVHPLADALRLGADYVLVAHTSFEQEMVAALEQVGYPNNRIKTLYSAAAFAALGEGRVETLAAGVHGPVDHLIVTSARSEVVSDAVLAKLYGRGRVLCAFVGRADGLPPDSPFEVVDLQESLAALKRVVQSTRPRTIYVRTIIYKNFLLPLLKRWSPESVVIGEPYDFTILWSGGDLELLFGVDSGTRRWLRLSEQLAGQTLDLMVSKRGGAGWRDLTATWRRPSLMFFPAVTQVDGPALSPGGLGDIVYAGFFPAAAFLKNFHSGYNFVPLLAEICRQGSLVGDLYNSGHMPGIGDRLFMDYMAGLPAPLGYHPRQPYEQMLRILSGYRYGWLCDHRGQFQGDREVGVCNRWTGYISAGLPCLIDKDWGLMAALTHDFSAGLVVDELTPDAILRQLQTADWPELRAGAGRLRDHLKQHNDTAVATLSSYLV